MQKGQLKILNITGGVSLKNKKTKHFLTNFDIKMSKYDFKGSYNNGIKRNVTTWSICLVTVVLLFGQIWLYWKHMLLEVPAVVNLGLMKMQTGWLFKCLHYATIFVISNGETSY